MCYPTSKRFAQPARTAYALISLAVLMGGGPTGCLSDFDPPVEPRCGNGVLDDDEVCDATLLDGASCASLGYQGGTLSCAADCTLNLTSCEEAGFCGNGRIETAYEACDGTLLGGATCDSLGLGGGDIICTGSCELDTSLCTGQCGDGAIQPGLAETCDGSDLAGDTCESLGYLGGELACLSDCSALDTADCVLHPTGGPCDEDHQCAGDLCWSEAALGWPSGTCTRDCANVACAPPAVCIENTNGDSRCHVPCTDSQDCRPGYACFDRWVSGTSVCHPLCAEDGHCPDTGTCNPYSRLCGTPQTGGDYGTACAVGTECLGGLCLSTWPGGYCTSMCSLTDGQCPASTGTVCVDVSQGNMGDLGACLPSCVDASDCARPGYTCTDTYLAPESICAPE